MGLIDVLVGFGKYVGCMVDSYEEICRGQDCSQDIYYFAPSMYVDA